jgi:hypothetical protein
MAHCLCCLRRERDANGSPTLGLFKPQSIKRLIIRKAVPSTWTEAELGRLRQNPLWGQSPASELEKIPFTFYYDFRCPEADCKGHVLSCTDWEMGQAYRSWHAQYGENGWRDKFLDRFQHDMIEVNDTHFYVGTVNNHPSEWIIVGLFYPRPVIASPQIGLGI